jgi:hypothetical protein
VVVGDTFVYRDESHMAESYAEVLTPVLRQRVRRLVGGPPDAAAVGCSASPR